MSKKISIIIGVYNSEKTIEKVIREIKEVFDAQSIYEWEAILVDDCSPDGVYRILKRLAKEDHRIKVVHLAKNAGQGNAVIEGYRFASGDFIIDMDDDYQMPAAEALRMLEYLEKENMDVVFAKYPSQKESLFRRLGSKFNDWTIGLMTGKPKGIRVNFFMVMRRFVMERCTEYVGYYPNMYGIIFATTSNVANLSVEHRPRASGRSNYTIFKLIRLWSNGFFNFSIAPLRFSMKAGGLIVCLAFIAACVVAVRTVLYGTKSVGWSSLIITIIFLSGVILLSIGMMGEYLGRLYLSSTGLPRATVRETHNIGNEKGENT